MPEWSKGLRSGRNVFELVGSNPTADILLHFTRPGNASYTTTLSNNPHSIHTTWFDLFALTLHNGHHLRLPVPNDIFQPITPYPRNTRSPNPIAMRRLLIHNLDGRCSSLPVCLLAEFTICTILCRVVVGFSGLSFLPESQICAWVHLQLGVG